jgi:hypothetical protein
MGKWEYSEIRFLLFENTKFMKRRAVLVQVCHIFILKVIRTRNYFIKIKNILIIYIVSIFS